MIQGNLLNQIKDKMYEIIYEGATAFPYSNDLMHTSLIGMIPFLTGKYTGEILGKKYPFFAKHSNKFGYLSSLLAEVLWQTQLEPSSPYDNPLDKISDFKGILETLAGAGSMHLLTNKFHKNKPLEKLVEDNKDE